MKDLQGVPAEYQGYYISDSRLDSFVGMWKWKDTNRSFSILLDTVKGINLKSTHKIDLQMDIIRGKYVYSTDRSNDAFQWSRLLFIDNGTTDDSNTLAFVVRDRYDGHMYIGKFIIDKKNPDQATFKFYQQEKHNIDYPGKPKPEKKEGVEIPGGVKSLEGKVLKRVTN